MRTCTVPDCDAPLRCVGLCGKHYKRLRDHGTTDAPRRPSVAERFWAKVEKTDGCWLWLGRKGREGHGTFYVTHSRGVSAYRWSYEALVGAIPDGLHVDHLCRNPACVRPDHLEPVTPWENQLRGIGGVGKVNAAKTHCHKGHEFDEANTYRGPKGERNCRACTRERNRRRRAGLVGVA